MAFVREEEDESRTTTEEKPSLSNVGSGVIGAAGGQVQQPTQKGSGQFTNLKQYIDANKDQSAAFADNTVSGLKSGFTDIQTKDLGSELNSFKSQTEQATIKDDESLRAKSAGQMTPEERMAYAARYQAQYNGPNNFTSEGAFNKLDQHGQTVQNTDSFEGTQSVIKDMYGKDRSRYTTGEQTFDTLLLNQPKENREKFASLRSWADGQPEAIKQGAMQTANDYITNAVNTTNATKQAFATDFANDNAALDAAIAEAIKTGNTQRAQEYRDAQANAAKAGLDEWSSYSPGGLSGGTQRDISQADYMEYGGDVGWQNVISDAQLADAAALAEIGGDVNANKYQGQRVDAAPAYTFNDAAYNNDVQAARAKGQTLKQQYDVGLESAVAPLKDQMKNLWGLSQVGMGGSPEQQNAIYDQVKDKPLPSNPMGFSTYGEYLNSIGITNGSDMINHFAHNENWQVDGSNDIRAGG